jgi:hypothetical protein
MAYILALAIALTYISIKWQNILASVVASASWIIMIVLSRANPIGGVELGSTADQMILLVLSGASIATLFYGFMRWRSGGRMFGSAGVDGFAPKINSREDTVNKIRSMRNTDYNESPEEYKARIRPLLRKKKR